MADPFDQIDAYLGAAVRALAPAERKVLMREIIRELRKRNQKRITAQEGPDGRKWPPRARKRDGRVKSTAKMLLGFRAARRMVLEATQDGASLGYRGSTAALALVHHFGQVDFVVSGGPRVKYPARPLLGVSAGDIDWVRQRVMDRITAALP